MADSDNSIIYFVSLRNRLGRLRVDTCRNYLTLLPLGSSWDHYLVVITMYKYRNGRTRICRKIPFHLMTGSQTINVKFMAKWIPWGIFHVALFRKPLVSDISVRPTSIICEFDCWITNNPIHKQLYQKLLWYWFRCHSYVWEKNETYSTQPPGEDYQTSLSASSCNTSLPAYKRRLTTQTVIIIQLIAL